MSGVDTSSNKDDTVDTMDATDASKDMKPTDKSQSEDVKPVPDSKGDAKEKKDRPTTRARTRSQRPKSPEKNELPKEEVAEVQPQPEAEGDKPAAMETEVSDTKEELEEFVTISSTYKDRDGKSRPRSDHHRDSKDRRGKSHSRSRSDKSRSRHRDTKDRDKSHDKSRDSKDDDKSKSSNKTTEKPKEDVQPERKLDVVIDKDVVIKKSKLFPNAKHNRRDGRNRTLFLGPIERSSLAEDNMDDIIQKAITMSATWKVSSRTKKMEGNLALHFMTADDECAVRSKIKERQGRLDDTSERLYLKTQSRHGVNVDTFTVEWEKALFPCKPGPSDVTSIFLHKLPPETTRVALYELFPESCGAVLPLLKDGTAEGYAMVEFLTLKEANKAASLPRTINTQSIEMFVLEKPPRDSAERQYNPSYIKSQTSDKYQKIERELNDVARSQTENTNDHDIHRRRPVERRPYGRDRRRSPRKPTESKSSSSAKKDSSKDVKPVNRDRGRDRDRNDQNRDRKNDQGGNVKKESQNAPREKRTRDDRRKDRRTDQPYRGTRGGKGKDRDRNERSGRKDRGANRGDERRRRDEPKQNQGGSDLERGILEEIGKAAALEMFKGMIDQAGRGLAANMMGNFMGPPGDDDMSDGPGTMLPSGHGFGTPFNGPGPGFDMGPDDDDDMMDQDGPDPGHGGQLGQGRPVGPGAGRGGMFYNGPGRGGFPQNRGAMLPSRGSFGMRGGMGPRGRGGMNQPMMGNRPSGPGGDSFNMNGPRPNMNQAHGQNQWRPQQQQQWNQWGGQPGQSRGPAPQQFNANQPGWGKGNVQNPGNQPNQWPNQWQGQSGQPQQQPGWNAQQPPQMSTPRLNEQQQWFTQQNQWNTSNSQNPQQWNNNPQQLNAPRQAQPQQSWNQQQPTGQPMKTDGFWSSTGYSHQQPPLKLPTAVPPPGTDIPLSWYNQYSFDNNQYQKLQNPKKL